MQHYILRDENNVAIGIIPEPIAAQPGQSRVPITQEEFQNDMIRSIFTDVNNYIPYPGTRNDTFFVAVNGAWVDTRSTDERWVAIREERDVALTASDWTQLADVPIDATKKNEWATWRMQLREIPQDYSDPDAAKSALDTLLANKP